jgi:hypothetical protein
MFALGDVEVVAENPRTPPRFATVSWTIHRELRSIGSVIEIS